VEVPARLPPRRILILTVVSVKRLDEMGEKWKGKKTRRGENGEWVGKERRERGEGD